MMMIKLTSNNPIDTFSITTQFSLLNIELSELISYQHEIPHHHTKCTNTAQQAIQETHHPLVRK